MSEVTAHPNRHAEKTRERVAYWMEPSDEIVPYAQLSISSQRIAAQLRELGPRRGDTVALLLENHPRFMAVARAAQRSGLRHTAISTRLTASELAYTLNDSGAAVLFTSAQLAETATAARAQAPGKLYRRLPRDEYAARVGA